MATQAQQVNFINSIAPIIQRIAAERGYHVCSPVIAQAICESNWGLSQLSLKYHNYFGLKCGSSWKGASVNMKTKEEYTPGITSEIRDNFRVYGSMEEGVKGYFDFISTKRYNALKNCTTPVQYLTEIKRAGYASSSTYVQTNTNIINKYHLTKFDKCGSLIIDNPKDLNPWNYILGNTYTTTVKLNVRNLPWGDVVKVYPKGTRFTNKGMMWYNNDIWMITPSGWVCTGKGERRYIE